MRPAFASLLVPLLALGWLASARAAPLSISDGRIALEADSEHGNILSVRDLEPRPEMAREGKSREFRIDG